MLGNIVKFVGHPPDGDAHMGSDTHYTDKNIVTHANEYSGTPLGSHGAPKFSDPT